MNVIAVRSFQFGADRDCKSIVGTGWSGAERDFRWMIGPSSEVHFEAECEDLPHLLELTVIPFTHTPGLEAQRLTVVVNGTEIGAVRVAHSGRLGFQVPASLLGSRSKHSIVLQHPDAARPSDFGGSGDYRQLALAVSRVALLQLRSTPSVERIEGTGGVPVSALQPLTGMEPKQFMLGFESVGYNCEFGLVQRKLGAEPLSLLRFSNIELPALLHGLSVAFQDFGKAANIEMRIDATAENEFVMKEKFYDVVYHTFRHVHDTDGEKLLAQEPARQALLVRKFIDDLRESRKIFVFKYKHALPDEEVAALFAAFAAYGPNKLLWVVEIDKDNRSGTVERTAAGFLKAYIDRFAPPENAHDLLLEPWLEICVNAWQLTQPRT